MTNQFSISKQISLALRLADEAVTRNRWALLSVRNEQVIVEVGPVNTDGSRQTKTATYRLYSDASGGIHYVTDVHP